MSRKKSQDAFQNADHNSLKWLFLGILKPFYIVYIIFRVLDG